MALPITPLSQSEIEAMLNQMTQQSLLNQMNQMSQQLGGFSNGGHWHSGQALYGGSLAPSGPGFTGALGLSPTAFAPFDPSPSLPVENAGIRAGEIIAWRCWRLERGFLRSMAVGTIWAPGEPMEGKPDDYGMLGVHAWKRQSKALEYARAYFGFTVVIGQVELWGEVVEHVDGYRAEYAAIASLCRVVNNWWPRSLKRLRREYGVGGTIVDAAHDAQVEGAERTTSDERK